MRFDEVLEHIGELGYFQIRIILLLSVHALADSMQVFGWIFIGATPKHRCRIPNEPFDNDTLRYSLPNETLFSYIPWDKENDRWDQCRTYVYNGTYVNTQETQPCHQWVYDDSQYSSTIVTQYDLVCDKKWMRDMVFTFSVIGEVIGLSFMGGIADRIGRRKIIFISYMVEIIVGILTGLVHNFYAFIFFRTMFGMFRRSAGMGSYVIKMEFVGPSKRTHARMFGAVSWSLGLLLISGLAYLIRDWIYLHYAFFSPALFCLITIWWIPESARWLISKNRSDEAIKIIENAAKLNKKTLPPITLEKDEELKSTKEPLLNSMKKFFLDPVTFYKVLILCFTWFTNGITYYGLNLNVANLAGNVYINFLINAALELPGTALTMYLLHKFGRRIPLCVFMILCGLALLAVIFVPKEFQVWVVVLSMIGRFCITSSFDIIYFYAGELYPTQIRQTAVGLNSIFARFGSMSSPHILTLKDYWKPLPFLIFGILSFVFGLLALFLPETNMKALPENFSDSSALMKQARTNTNSNVASRTANVYKNEAMEMNNIN